MLEREALKEWSRELEFFWVNQVGWRFRRAEARERGLKYVKGLLSDAKHKNGWQLAETEGEAQADGMQRVLNGSVWDADGVRDAVREWVGEAIGSANAVVVVDETGFLKKGQHSAGVKRQYSGTAGRIENCQVGVFLAYTHRNDYALIDRELYLPEEWTSDAARRADAHIAESVTFATKGALARAMLERAFESRLPFGWVTADSIYGGDYKIRKLLEDHACAYVLAVTSAHKVWYGFKQIAVAALLAARSEQSWQRLSCGAGAKGERLYDWAFLPLPRVPENERFVVGVLVRRSLTDAKLTYYLTFAPHDTPLLTLVSVAGARWKVEECFELAKQEVGLADYEVRHYTAWYRHITLSMLALAFLTVVRHAIALDELPKKRPGRPPTARSRLPSRTAPSAHPPRLEPPPSA